MTTDEDGADGLPDELVEAVARAIVAVVGGWSEVFEWPNWAEEARAAIGAVREWDAAEARRRDPHPASRLMGGGST